MKKFTSILCALVIALSASAVPQRDLTQKTVGNIKIEKKATRFEKVAPVKLVNRARKAAGDALASGTFYTTGGAFYVYGSSGWQDATSSMPSIEVTVDGSNVTIVGLAYYFEDGAIQGTLEGNTITCANGQLVGTDDYGDEFLVGSNDGGSTLCDIVFTFDPETQTLTSETAIIAESSKADQMSVYSYWYNAVFSAEEPEAPELVELPEGAEVVEYTMDFTTGAGEPDAKAINVAVVGNQVFFQGISHYLSDAWVVGTKEGNTVTFAAKQYVGAYSDVMVSYAFYNGAAVFTYDSEADTYTAEGEIFGVMDASSIGYGNVYDGRYINPVLSRTPEINLDDAKEVAITTAEGEYDETYQEIIYTLSNATNDTIFAFDIMLEENQTDVVLGQTYTLEDMYSQVAYTYVQIGETKTSLKSVEFVKTKNESGLPHIEATVVDNKINVYHLVYDLQLSGEVINIAFEVPMSVPQHYDDGSWEVYCKSLTGDTIVSFVYNSEDAESLAGTFTESDLQSDYSGIKIGDEVIRIVKAEIEVTDTDERIDVVATVVSSAGDQYNITMFFVKPVVTTQETIASEEMTLDKSLFDWYSVIKFDASDENNAISLTVNVEGLGALMAGEYVAGTDFNGTVTPTAGKEVEIYSGTITIAVAENGDVTLTGTVLATNNVEYTLNLKYIKPEPVTTNLTMTAATATQGDGYVRYKLSNDDYAFFFKINLTGELTDVESGVAYTFAEDMGANTNGSYGIDYNTYDYIDYADAAFTKTETASEIRIVAAIEDVDGNFWNLLYVETLTGVDNVNADVKAVKRIENGMLFIEKNGVRYNVLGTVVK